MTCHFLKDKKISISLLRRFQVWLLGVLSVFTSDVQGGFDAHRGFGPDGVSNSAR
jgi:hypothetical protein